MLELKNIVKTFSTKGQEIHAVRGVTLTVEKGEIFGIVGYSGAGKSTLIRIINQLEKQTSGDVIIDGVNISLCNARELRQQRMKIGMIFQHFNLLWSRTVKDNIALALEIAQVDKQQRELRVVELINLVGLQGRENAYPSELSGGQKQRVGIARALANNPTLLLCDEATSALDPETTDSILELLKKINVEYGLTIVLITHQMEVVSKICHRLAVMSDGVVVECGSVQQLFEKPQHEVTKRFMQSDHVDVEKLRKELRQYYPYGQIARLSFVGALSNQPILAEAMKSTTLSVSIVSGQITPSQSGPLGTIVVHLSNGSDQEMAHFTKKLSEKGVLVEIL